MNYLRTEAWHQARMQELARKQRGFIINPYSFGTGGGAPPPANVISLAHFDGTNGNTGPFADIVPARSPGWTRVGTGPQLSTAEAVYGTAALDVAAVGVYNADHADWDFGSGDFTIEYWMKHTNLNGAGGYTVHIFKGVNGGKSPFLILNVGGDVYFRLSTDGSNWTTNFVGSAAAPTGTAKHYAMCREGGTLYGYAGGTNVGSGSVSGALWTNTDPVYFGCYGASTSEALTGFGDDLRVHKGLAVYPGGVGFTPTGPHPDS